MLKKIIAFGVLVAGLCGQSPTAHSEDWPGWRGPRGDGTSLDVNAPLRWNGTTGENVAWKVAAPGEGVGSPIVCRDRVFFVSCLTDSQERVLASLDRHTGRTLWQRTVIKAPLEIKHRLNSFASSTPATDGELVYVTFFETDGSEAPAPNVGTPRPLNPGQIVVAAYDFAGERKWIVRPGGFASVHGFCSNPVLFRDLLIVNGDHDGDSYIVALNRQTGETVWKQPRAHKTRSYVTPLIREIDGRPQMVLSGSYHIAGLDPRDGAPLWTVEGPAEQFVASMVYDGRQFYMVAGFPTHHAMAIRPDGMGDVTKTHVAWHVTNVSCYVPSPVVVGEYLVVADDRGTANCFDTASGKRLWQTRLGSHYSASLVTAGGRVYFTADDGVTRIVQPGPELEIVAENQLGESCYASPAISDGQLFIRGEKNLYCIGPKGASN
ncbi:MAG TPA: PQQ-binding-like beta-propeller repeat protein [Planctomycetaceae bacterium]|nr:PQQ-binding-like beta-propeller repeat protein [Planctomycetaceae bacterium]